MDLFYGIWTDVFFGSLLTFVGGIVSINQTPGIKALEKEMQRLNNELELKSKEYSEIFNGELALLFNLVEFTNDERISVYKHNEKAFVMIGRYSSNPNYCKPGRVIYPDDQGCIGEAWAKGESFTNDLPNTEVRWLQKLNKDWNIPKSVAQNITMKSRTLAAFAIRKPNISKDYIAVIVFESMRDQAFDKSNLKQQLESAEEKRLALLIEKEAAQPMPSIALKEGY